MISTGNNINAALTAKYVLMNTIDLCKIATLIDSPKLLAKLKETFDEIKFYEHNLQIRALKSQLFHASFYFRAAHK